MPSLSTSGDYWLEDTSGLTDMQLAWLAERSGPNYKGSLSKEEIIDVVMGWKRMNDEIAESTAKRTAYEVRQEAIKAREKDVETAMDAAIPEIDESVKRALTSLIGEHSLGGDWLDYEAEWVSDPYDAPLDQPLPEYVGKITGAFRVPYMDMMRLLERASEAIERAEG